MTAHLPIAERDAGRRVAAPAPRIPEPRASQELRQRHLERVLALDPLASSRLARVAHLAKTVFGVASAAVVLADGPTGPIRTTSPDGAGSPDDEFFARTVDAGAPLLVPDATAGEFARLPQVSGPPHLRFFAGIPLADDGGVVLGALCLYDTAPRRLDAAAWATLNELAEWARRDLVDSEDMLRARRVQESLLPRSAPELEGYDVAGLCLPTKAVGGDFYDFTVAPGRLSVSLVDVMGKGPAAALVAATVRALLRATMSEVAVGLGGRRPEDANRPLRGGVGGVVADIDRLVTPDLDLTGTLVTGFFADLVTETGALHYVDAGHGLTLLVRRDRQVEWLRTADLPIGVEPVGSWSQQRTTLHPGDTLLCMSDGLLDLVGAPDEAMRGLASLALQAPDPRDLIRRIRRMSEHGVPVDDVTAVAVRREDDAA